ncbi:MAG: hypothetical protein Q8M98_01405 [Candidatus Cloacimonadaceae bacterium]|nr:hypothetical protein [Candidatus Cloacimonadaceae bacterium]
MANGNITILPIKKRQAVRLFGETPEPHSLPATSNVENIQMDSRYQR